MALKFPSSLPIPVHMDHQAIGIGNPGCPYAASNEEDGWLFLASFWLPLKNYPKIKFPVMRETKIDHK